MRWKICKLHEKETGQLPWYCEESVLLKKKKSLKVSWLDVHLHDTYSKVGHTKVPTDMLYSLLLPCKNWKSLSAKNHLDSLQSSSVWLWILEKSRAFRLSNNSYITYTICLLFRAAPWRLDTCFCFLLPDMAFLTTWRWTWHMNTNNFVKMMFNRPYIDSVLWRMSTGCTKLYKH